jgi:hypothetical protein
MFEHEDEQTLLEKVEKLRMLLESVCKHILDEAGKPYASDLDLPKLWALTAENLNLAPHQHQEEVFKAIQRFGPRASRRRSMP